MVMEHAETNIWHEVYIQGKQNYMHVENTSWAFEFNTESPRIEVWVKVPDGLDMYEVRLYHMGNPELEIGDQLEGVPLAWEPGLYGVVGPLGFGGYNLESKGFAGVASASCEFYGQDMLINYSSPFDGDNLYHLVFIGEEGNEVVNFLVKTEFGLASIEPLSIPERGYPGNDTMLAFVSLLTDLENATLVYSVNGWQDIEALSMQIVDNRTAIVLIPGQSAGLTVEYEVHASDILANILTWNGSYPVKHISQLNISIASESITLGENLTVTGQINPAFSSLAVEITYTSANGTFQQVVMTLSNGTFVASFQPDILGGWRVQAVFYGDDQIYETSSTTIHFSVAHPSFLQQYSMYIFLAGAGIGVAGVVLLYLRKRRE
jgi:hypothetical protein